MRPRVGHWGPAEAVGQALSSTVLDEVERSVNAAIIDASVGAAVLTGRLIRSVNADDGNALNEAAARDAARAAAEAERTQAERDALERRHLEAPAPATLARSPTAPATRWGHRRASSPAP